MEDEVFLSVSEFAKKANISRQSIYKSCNSNYSKLSPYIKNTPEGKKISSKALILYSQAENGPCQPGVKPMTTQNQLPVNPESTTCKAEVNQETVNVDTPLSTSTDNQAQAAVLATLEVLTAQLQEKDKQIERLQLETQALREAGAEKDKLIREQMKLLSQAQELVRNNQILLAQGATAAAASEAAEDTPPVEQANIAQKKGKKSFFKWLFG